MRSKKVTLGLLIFYLAALTWIIVFKMSFSFEGLPHIKNINLIPFAESVIVNGKMDFSEIIQNLLAFIPFGVFLNVLWKEKSLLKQLLPIVCTSFLYEAVQFIFAIGASDITDLISNSLGGLIGIGIAAAISKKSGKRGIMIINFISLLGAAAITFLIVLLIIANWN